MLELVVRINLHLQVIALISELRMEMVPRATPTLIMLHIVNIIYFLRRGIDDEKDNYI